MLLPIRGGQILDQVRRPSTISFLGLVASIEPLTPNSRRAPEASHWGLRVEKRWRGTRALCSTKNSYSYLVSPTVYSEVSSLDAASLPVVYPEVSDGQ